MTRKTFGQTVDDFIEASSWLGAEHGPAVTTLEALAEELDKAVQAPLVTAFGIAYRALVKSAPVASGGDDPLAAALSAVPK